jgi:purine-binding chemotaxis protein CheW
MEETRERYAAAPEPGRGPGTREAQPAQAGAAGGGGQVELLGFMLSDEEYALDILEIKEIVRLQPITAVPRSPAWLKGIVTLRGVIVPIFDLRSRLGLQEIEHGTDTRIVVVYRGEELAGLIVDRITQVMRVGIDAIEPPPQTIAVVEAEFLRGVARFRDRLVILLNLARVLDVTA